MPCSMSCGREFCPGVLAQLRSIAGRVTCATQIGGGRDLWLNRPLKLGELNLTPRWIRQNSWAKTNMAPNILLSEIGMVGIHWFRCIAKRPVPLPMLDSKAGWFPKIIGTAGLECSNPKYLSRLLDDFQRFVCIPPVVSHTHTHTHPRIPDAKQRFCIIA